MNAGSGVLIHHLQNSLLVTSAQVFRLGFLFSVITIFRQNTI